VVHLKPLGGEHYPCPSRHLSNFARIKFRSQAYARPLPAFGTFKHMPDRSLVERIASGEERPFDRMSAPELILHAQTNWDDVFCLYQIVAEES
jgi:hypothetical protein